MRTVATLVLLPIALLAGCADGGGGGGGGDAPADAPAAFEEVVVTSTTGAIRGVVVTEAIVPVEGALVAITNGPNRTTDADGAFVFNGLEPGTYFLTASGFGYLPVQTSVDVVAGNENPPITKLTLLVNQAVQPFTSLQQWTAFLQCGAGIPGAGSLNPCALTGSDNVHEFPFDGRVPDFAQAEVVWEGTQPLGNELSFGFYDPDSLASNWKTANGQSPLILNATKEEIVDALGNESEQLIARIFPGRSSPTVITNQAYDVYVQYFYGFVPRSSYSFVAEGPCTVPANCS